MFYAPVLYDWANSGFVDVFLRMVGVVLVLWELVLFKGMGVEFKGEIMYHHSRGVKLQ